MSLEQLLAWIPPGSPDETLARQINFDRLPAHVAIIMDGNGRWAAQRHLPRVEGHRAGIDSVRDVVETSARLGIGVLTLYAFSVENWKRPRAEVNTLMMLLKRYLRLELEHAAAQQHPLPRHRPREELAPDVQRRARAPASARRRATPACCSTSRSTTAAAPKSSTRRAGRSQPGIAPRISTSSASASFLYTAGQPDPDLLIRTSGEMRVSNFLLWQIAYAEIWVTDTLWPDFRRRDLLEADPGLPEARPALRRHQAVAGGARREVTRVLSGARAAVGSLRRRLVCAGVLFFAVADAARRRWRSSNIAGAGARRAALGSRPVARCRGVLTLRVVLARAFGGTVACRSTWC